MRLNILLVEDNADDAYFFMSAIAEMNGKHTISIVKSHGELFSLLARSSEFDLIFMDLNLPGQDGKKCVRELKAHPDYRRIPIISFTGSLSETDSEDMYALGVHYHIVKPYAYRNYFTS